MSLKKKLRTILVCSVLQMAALFGAPMRPEEVQELMHSLNVPKVAETKPEEDAHGDPQNPEPVVH